MNACSRNARSNGHRSSLVSQQSTATSTAPAPGPRYVAELSEYQPVVVDIPPLVRSLAPCYCYCYGEN